MSTPTTPPAGWYTDPSNPAAQRYWDGSQWTSQTRSIAPTWPQPTVPSAGATQKLRPASYTPEPQSRRNIAGLVALGLTIAGIAVAFAPDAFLGSFALLLAAFITAIVALTRRNRGKAAGITALVLSVVGGGIATLMMLGSFASHLGDSGPKMAGPSGAEEVSVNARGNIEKAYGDSSSVLSADESEAVTFTVEKIHYKPECDGNPGFRLPPENGRFVAIKLNLTTSADYIGNITAVSPMRLFWSDWVAYDAQGNEIENGPNGLFCLAESKSFPLEIPEGYSETKFYVMDLPDTAVAVAWKPTYLGLPDGSGWEWKLPAE